MLKLVDGRASVTTRFEYNREHKTYVSYINIATNRFVDDYTIYGEYGFYNNKLLDLLLSNATRLSKMTELEFVTMIFKQLVYKDKCLLHYKHTDNKYNYTQEEDFN